MCVCVSCGWGAEAYQPGTPVWVNRVHAGEGQTSLGHASIGQRVVGEGGEIQKAPAHFFA